MDNFIIEKFFEGLPNTSNWTITSDDSLLVRWSNVKNDSIDCITVEFYNDGESVISYSNSKSINCKYIKDEDVKDEIMKVFEKWSNNY